jgi:2-polyprenyl-3-methyl-5-hydroxy-6-metoxy-1,4-benzoquinol methylase
MTEPEQQSWKTAWPRLESVHYDLGGGRIVPFDPKADYFLRRVEFDRARLADVLESIVQHGSGRRVLDLAAAPYILDAALLTTGYDVTLTGLPFGQGLRGIASLTVDGTTHECRLDLFDVEVESFPYPDAFFDVVVAGEIFEHLNRQPWQLLAETWRCLASDGVLVLSTPNSERLELLYAWLRRRPASFGFNPDAPTVRHAREYGPSELQAVLESQGFDMVALRTPVYSQIAGGFTGRLGGAKRVVYRALKRGAARQRGFLAQRGDSIVAVARKSARAPGSPPDFMLYGVGTAKSGYNFALDDDAD